MATKGAVNVAVIALTTLLVLSLLGGCAGRGRVADSPYRWDVWMTGQSMVFAAFSEANCRMLADQVLREQATPCRRVTLWPGASDRVGQTLWVARYRLPGGEERPTVFVGTTSQDGCERIRTGASSRQLTPLSPCVWVRAVAASEP